MNEIKVFKENILRALSNLGRKHEGESAGSQLLKDLFPEVFEEEKYPCHECGVLRTKDEGGTTFTVCDNCWDKASVKEEKKESELGSVT